MSMRAASLPHFQGGDEGLLGNLRLAELAQLSIISISPSDIAIRTKRPEIFTHSLATLRKWADVVHVKDTARMRGWAGAASDTAKPITLKDAESEAEPDIAAIFFERRTNALADGLFRFGIRCGWLVRVVGL